MIKNILAGSTSIILGLVFLFSAYIKLYPIELFEFSFIEISVANWTTAPFIARFFLALEFFFGILLLLNYNGGNRLLAKLTVGILIFFSIYLLIIIAIQGNSGNCGCFGTYIKMTPLESIIKNVILLSLSLVLFLVPESKNFSSQKIVVWACVVSSIATPFILNPVSENHPPAANEINYSLKLDALYETQKKDIPPIDLRKGKRVIAFLSLTCPHCKLGAQKLNILKNQHPELPIYFILNGAEADLKAFLEESKTTIIKYSFMTAKEGFVDNAGLNLPSILWVNNGKVEQRTKYTELEEKLLLEWYKKQ
jgi:hypothetical protein